ncbi:MAG TPA: two-component regulator propeller domain-containing protein, partial [Ideonella sp.]|nr:two-component regulator propeller domain-containing protein [Ideonella sp.]
AIAQTADGYLWLASNSGLYRFDGLRFERYELSSPGQRRSRDISALSTTPDGSLWIGYRFGGISRLKEGALSHLDTGLPPVTVYQVAIDAQGGTWAATVGGLFRLEGTRWEAVGAAWRYPSTFAGLMLIDARGQLWVNNGTSWSVLAGGARQFDAEPRFPATQDLALAPDGTLWRWSGAGAISAVAGPGAGAAAPPWRPDFNFGSLLFERSGGLWLNTYGRGLRRIAAPQQADPRLRRPIESFTRANGLTSDHVMSAFEDREGNLWFGTSGGLDRFRDSPVVLTPFEHGPATGVLAPAGGGEVWTGGINQPAARLDAAGRVTAIPGLGNIISCAYRDPQGVVWLGGISQLWRQAGAGFEAVPLPAQVQPNSAIQTITMDGDGALWVYLRRAGLLRLQGGRWHDAGSVLDGPFAKELLVLATDPQGRVWVGHAGNRISLIERGVATRRFQDDSGLDLGRVNALHFRGEHVWAGGELGLQVLRGERFHSLRLADGPPLRGVSGIVETADGSLWLNEAGGFVHIPGAEVAAALRDTSHGLQAERFDALDGVLGSAPQIRPVPSAIEAGDGRLWFTTDAGVHWLDPQRRYPDPPPPTVDIASISTAAATYPAADGLRLPEGSSQVRIRYTAPSLSLPERVQFRYRLDGVESEWQAAGSRREATYTSLQPGHYRFRVRAASPRGVWSETESSVAFEVPPAFHQTGFFRLLCALLAAGLLAWGWRLRLRRVSRGLRAQAEARVAERERIARELHDTLLQSTVGLIMHVQAAAEDLPEGHAARQSMEAALQRADKVLIEGRNRVMDLRGHDPSLELSAAIVASVTELAQASRSMVHTALHGPVKPLRPEVWEEALRIGREALCNAIQHADAARIDVSVAYGDDAFRLGVRDDGRGMDAAILSAQRKPGHWGLVGMRERADAIGAPLEIASAPGRGTEVRLSLPAAQAYAPDGAASPGHWDLLRRLWRVS